MPVYEVVAARQGSAPRYFARLRPPQMAIAVLGLILLFLAAAQSG
ncbi:hypothetical protein ABVV53_16105 [Novosphingobium sp. RD2P27]|uniref:Uncharacterized protein n=1 Tax=Novosphingobium kalidii TaxID=3230299 RepID=A0ABV2D543_9SPHN